MFLSKGLMQLRGPLAKSFSVDNVLIPHRFSSTVATTSSQPPTEKAIPDKLYKKIEIEVRGNDREVLKSYSIFTSMAADNLGIHVSRNIALKKPVHERETVLKSVHIYKKHRVQYETRTYFRYLDVERLTGSTADTFLEYIQRNLPEGVAMKITKVEIQRRPDSVSSPSV